MIIIARRYGDHSNRLFQAARFEAFCKKYGVRYFNPSFCNMARYYPNFQHKGYYWMRHIIHLLRFLRLIRPVIVSSVEELQELHQKHRLVFVEGFTLSVDALLQEYQDYFIHQYALDPRLLEGNHIVQKMKAWKAQGVTVLGVHVRRGDYTRWREGRHFYDDDTYGRLLDTAAELLKAQGRTVRCILCSNETVTLKTRQDYVLTGCAWTVDQYLLSQCDYIIGPPSTFTLWASYMGKALLCHVQSSTEEIRLEHFKQYP